MNLFFSTKRRLIAMFFVLCGIIGIFSELAGGISCIIVGLVILIPEIIYLAIPAEHWWGIWNDTLKSNAQKTRMNRARSGDLTPRSIDTKFKNAVFVGSEGGKYFTTLRKCTCPDFQKRGVPCKHMFYLANEMHLIDSEQVNSDDI